jgi:hypothetical protein
VLHTLIKLALVQPRTSQPERVKRPASLIGAVFTTQRIRDQGFSRRHLAKTTMGEGFAHGQHRQDAWGGAEG